MPSAFNLIETKTLSSSVNTIQFLNIPQSYRNLQLWISVQGSSGAVGRDDMWIYFNSESSGSYLTNRMLFYDGNNKLGGFEANYGSSTAVPHAYYGSRFTNYIAEIPNYTNTISRKNVLVRGGYAAATNQAFNELQHAIGTTTNAVTQINLQLSGGQNFSIGSVISLYGLSD